MGQTPNRRCRHQAVDRGSSGAWPHARSDGSLGLSPDRLPLASRGSKLGALGKPLTRFHLEALTRVQQRIFAVSGEPASRWGAYLAGGTALAIYFGHRRSEDFDWFTPTSIPPNALLGDVEALGFAVEVHQNTEGTFLGLVGGVKFSVFRYRYDLLAPTTRLDGSQLASLPDLAAMKLAAICGRATKKDYVDLHALMTLGRMSLSAMAAAFVTKYPTGDPIAAVRAVGYFQDAEKQTMPLMLNRTSWKNVKDRLSHSVVAFDWSSLR